MLQPVEATYQTISLNKNGALSLGVAPILQRIVEECLPIADPL